MATINPNLRFIPAKNSTDVMVGTYVSASDPFIVEENAVLSQKLWLEVDANGLFKSLKFRTGNEWQTIFPAAAAASNPVSASIYSDMTVPVALAERTTFTGDEDQDEILQLLKAILKRGGAVER